MENEDLKKAVGKRIKELRRSYGLSQEQLSEAIDISITFYGLVERGNRMLSLNNLLKVCKIFNVNLDFLILGKQSEHSNTIKISALFNDLNESEIKFINGMIMESRYMNLLEHEFILSMTHDFIKMRRTRTNE